MAFEDKRAELLAAFREIAEPDAAVEKRLDTVAALLTRADEISAVLAVDGLVVRGSTGQKAAHPLLNEERHLRAQADKIYADLLPDDPPDESDEPAEIVDMPLTAASVRARNAARSRWDRVAAGNGR